MGTHWCEGIGCSKSFDGAMPEDGTWGVWGGRTLCFDHNQLALVTTQLNVEGERCREAIAMLSSVLHTLRSTAASPADAAVYAEARALLAEHGMGGPGEEHVKATREWEARR